MKAKHLIEFLEMIDPEKEVVLHGFQGESVMFVLSAQNTDTCCLETESDVNMVEELYARFDAIANNHNPEYEEEMYRIMLRQGITPDIVEKYIGKEYSDKMKQFCEEYKIV